MLTTLETREVETHGVIESNTFSIQANGKAFKVLIDGLYSDKIRAVIRELWTNAFDSHADAGCPERPFACHLPTVFEPVFSVRDYGTGLSHDDVMHLYTTVFASSKENTNAQVGKLGLGSKSPFAYTDTFTVMTWDGTTKRSYSVYVGPSYIPMIALLGVETCYDDRGLEVSFPVKPNDCDAFRRAAQRMLPGFDVAPEFSGETLVVPLETVVLQGDGWKLLAHGEASAQQGCVRYPLDASAVSGATDADKALLELPLVIQFPIGELEVTANRESLSYDKTTSANILARLDGILKHLVEHFSQEIHAAKTYWEACVAYQRLTENSAVRRLFSRGGVLWRGTPVDASIGWSEALLAGKGDALATYIDASRMRHRQKKFKWEPTSYVKLDPQRTVVIVEDTSLPRIANAGERIRHNRDRFPGGARFLWLKGNTRSANFRRAYVTLGRPPVTFVHDLPKPVAASRSYTRSAVQCKVLQGYYLSDATVDGAAGGIYFPMERGEIMTPAGKETSVSCVYRLFKALVAAQVLTADTPVYGIPATHKRMYARNPRWRNIFVIAQQYFDTIFDAQLAADYEAAAECVRPSSLSQLCDYVQQKNVALHPYSELAELVRTFRELSKVVEDLEPQRICQEIRSQMNLVRVSLPAARTPSADSLEARFCAAYPLLQYINLNDETLSHALAYVNLIDNAQASSHLFTAQV